jgi:DNA-binding NarL/FixJ family response regulator
VKDLFEKFPELANVPVTFGLSQKKRDLVAQLLSEGKPWDEIARTVGWEPNTLREYYERK